MKYIRFKCTWIKNQNIKTGLAGKNLKTCPESTESENRNRMEKSGNPEVAP